MGYFWECCPCWIVELYCSLGSKDITSAMPMKAVANTSAQIQDYYVMNCCVCAVYTKFPLLWKYNGLIIENRFKKYFPTVIPLHGSSK